MKSNNDYLVFANAGKINQDAIYCPGDIRREIDAEMALEISSMIDKFNLYQIIFRSNDKRLRNLNCKSKLYIIVHGNTVTQPAIAAKSIGKYSAPQLAALLQKDGLRKSHRNIELLYCNSGRLVSTFKRQHKALCPFAIQLFDELKKKGYRYVEVI